MKKLTIAVAAAALFATPAFAQQGGHADMAKQEYMKSMQEMHQTMMAATDADPDRAFALKMIEHHKGAIAMTEVLMKHGDDAEIKRMAQKSMDMQKKEIGELESWLDRHGGRAPKR